LSKYRQAAENLEDYQVNRYYKDGQYQSDKMVKELYIADNFDKILNSAISQAVNQTRLEMLKQSKNIQSEQFTSGTFKPNAADDERAMLDQLFMGHLRRQS
jgi:transcriptional regulator NrdR family protein